MVTWYGYVIWYVMGLRFFSGSSFNGNFHHSSRRMSKHNLTSDLQTWMRSLPSILSHHGVTLEDMQYAALQSMVFLRSLNLPCKGCPRIRRNPWNDIPQWSSTCTVVMISFINTIKCLCFYFSNVLNDISFALVYIHRHQHLWRLQRPGSWNASQPYTYSSLNSFNNVW